MCFLMKTLTNVLLFSCTGYFFCCLTFYPQNCENETLAKQLFISHFFSFAAAAVLILFSPC